ncbi:MAG: hypothetical protein GC159_18650 [Phycisphaera sp.]|nr:hypothetical protein [Phycisphaera sp.]
MRSMNRTRWMVWSVVALFALMLSAWVSTGAGQPKEAPLKTLMKQKLADSQAVLEGIAVEDFDKIAKRSDSLLALSQQAEWMVFDDAAYRGQSEAFRRAVQQMAREAKAKNVDGAAMGYVQMTLACVSCHKVIREKMLHKRL